MNFDELVSNIAYFHEISRGTTTINIKINGDVVPGGAEQKFLDTFGDICDEINIEHVMACWSGFDFDGHGVKINQSLTIYGRPLISEVLVCPYIFYSFSINSDGSASVCFLDWDRRRIIGNVNVESVVEIWNGEPMRAYQRMMLSGHRKSYGPCATCGQMTHGEPDNIDPFRESLLEKFVQIA